MCVRRRCLSPAAEFDGRERVRVRCGYAHAVCYKYAIEHTPTHTHTLTLTHTQTHQHTTHTHIQALERDTPIGTMGTSIADGKSSSKAR
jgi:hypothetical protein